jgi:hypothetical protein
MQYMPFRDAIAFSSEWISYSCATAGAQLSEKDIYIKSCTLLQDSLFATCCQGARESNNSTIVIAASISTIVGIGIVGALLMWRHRSNQKPNLARGAFSFEVSSEPLPVEDSSEHFPFPPSAPPTYSLEASDPPSKNSPPPYQPQVIAKAVDLPPAYDSSCLPSHADPPPPYKSDG